jgi:lysozyme
MPHPKEKTVNVRQLPSFPTTLAFIRREEGLRLAVYLCPAGVKTVGWGHVVEPHDGLNLGDCITEERATQFLESDVMRAYQALFRFVSIPLDDAQQTALVSFIFNLGGSRFQASTLRQKINRREFEDAAQEFGRWVYARDPLKGLLRLKGLASRRRREQMLFLGHRACAPSSKLRASAPIKHPKRAPLPSSLWQKVAATWVGLLKAGWSS